VVLQVVPWHRPLVHAVPSPVAVPPPHVPVLQNSLLVQTFPSSQAVVVRHRYAPPWSVQWYEVELQVFVAHWFPEPHVTDVPLPHVPVALFAPHPPHVLPVVLVTVPQESAHAPAVVEHPDDVLHAAVQQPFAVQFVVPDDEHVHDPLQPVPPLHVLLHVAGYWVHTMGLVPVHVLDVQPVVPQAPPGSYPAPRLLAVVWLDAALQNVHAAIETLFPYQLELT
jgi:hypothetical protein